MGKHFQIAIIVALATLMGSCATGGDSSSPEGDRPATLPTESPESSQVVGQDLTIAPSPDVEVLVVQDTNLAQGLIPSTNPQSRVQEVQRGRSDPFAIVPLQPTITVAEPEAGTSPPPPPPSPPETTNSTPEPPVEPAYVPPPPLPEPTLAQAVEVQGVVQVDGRVHAIVKAPEEPSSRYITSGQRLSNGQVLVKEIILRGMGEPAVVLEQYGVEVVRSVGEEPNASSDQDQAGSNPDSLGV